MTEFVASIVQLQLPVVFTFQHEIQYKSYSRDLKILGVKNRVELKEIEIKKNLQGAWRKRLNLQKVEIA